MCIWYMVCGSIWITLCSPQRHVVVIVTGLVLTWNNTCWCDKHGDDQNNKFDQDHDIRYCLLILRYGQATEDKCYITTFIINTQEKCGSNLMKLFLNIFWIITSNYLQSKCISVIAVGLGESVRVTLQSLSSL